MRLIDVTAVEPRQANLDAIELVGILVLANDPVVQSELQVVE